MNPRRGAILALIAILTLAASGCQPGKGPPSSPVEPPQTPTNLTGLSAPPREIESPLQPDDTGAGAAPAVSTATAPLAVDAATPVETEPEEPLTATGECRFEYFFEPSPEACPLTPALPSWAAEQPFEGGLLIWLEQVRGGPFDVERTVIAFFDDGHWTAFDDTWTSDQPDRDASITPPEGLYQPVRGFGKLWREDSELHQRLGWATKPEIGYDALWQGQWQMDASAPSVIFLRTLVSGVVRLQGWDFGAGTWERVAP